jgi:hypothetical protein
MEYSWAHLERVHTADVDQSASPCAAGADVNASAIETLSLRAAFSNNGPHESNTYHIGNE